MKIQTNTAIVAQYHPPQAQRTESAGGCMVVGCGGTLEIRHERQFGKVYAVCVKCEQRVTLVARLRRELEQLRAAAISPDQLTTRERREIDVVRRYLDGDSSHTIAAAVGMSWNAILKLLRRRQIVIRPSGRRRTATPRPHGTREARVYRERPCASEGCGALFMPTGGRARYCGVHTTKRSEVAT